ncbi:Protein farnesyltransferase/geranylgeranyltransferase type-1 subunit alpha [Yarrowia sp. C11]|nr:Protein farnesyltransferase/geranylgeranyltransferase type-1 subunit alpha [Yarrowia sp. E02]KAG5372672.1 Protein farnesyltransferase/geranylgeranyltransferase type-1 subunit alpha [Yarrowia sp. C11]
MSYNFDDLEVIPLQESEHALASIAYTDQYKEATGLLRALMAKDEKSQRGLHVASAVIALNPAHYTVWAYRIDTLKSFAADVKAGAADKDEKLAALQQELSWVNDIAQASPKNYQIWPHRQQLLDLFEANPELLGEELTLDGEIELMDSLLSDDSKNHHVWSYRQWLVARFPKLINLDSELATTSIMIQEDCRNNSAWNHRFFLLKLKNDNKQEWTSKPSFEEEVEFVTKTIDKAPQNHSPWLYIEGLYTQYKKDIKDLQELTFKYACIPSDLGEDEEPLITSSHALDLLAKIYLKDQEKSKALEALDLLEEKYDPIRKGYWAYRKKLVEA